MRRAFARVRRPIKCLVHDCTYQDQIRSFLPFLIREKAWWNKIVEFHPEFTPQGPIFSLKFDAC